MESLMLNEHLNSDENEQIRTLTALIVVNYGMFQYDHLTFKNIIDNDFKYFQLVKNSAFQTILVLLKIEEICDLNKYNGKSFLNDLMDVYGEYLWQIYHSNGFTKLSEVQWMPIFWRSIWEKIYNLEFDMNLQNKQGYTALHFAVQNEYAPVDVLEKILTNYNLDPLLCDNKGNTFLHYYLVNYDKYRWSEFNHRLFRGEINNLPKSVFKKLVNSQNNTKDTPLHLFVTCYNTWKENGIPNVDQALYMDDDCTLLRLLEAGSDLTLSNLKGNTVMKCFLTHDDLKDTDIIQAVKSLVKYDADINAKNKRGESVLFLYTPSEVFRSLIDFGGDVNLKNNSEQTPLISLICKSKANKNEEKENVEKIKLLLDSGADENVTDIYGNDALHYAAWNRLGLDIVLVLLRHNISHKRDKLGQLPCDVAVWRGAKHMLGALCICENKDHNKNSYLTCLEDSFHIFDSLSNTFKHLTVASMSDILNVPGVGKVVFENEAKEIKTVVTEIVTNICKKIKEVNNFFSFTLLKSGSVSEDTKVGLPDEFDFVCIFDRISELICVSDNESSSGFVYVKPKPSKKGEVISNACVNLKGYIDISFIRNTLHDIVKDIFDKDEIFCYPNISHVQYQLPLNPTSDPVIYFIVQWKGCFYKNLSIDIDLVPACQVSGWWPSNANITTHPEINQTIKDEGALLVLQTNKYANDDYTLRISALFAEMKLMKSLPQIAKDAYTSCKIYCNRYYQNSKSHFSDPIKSYMLKTCMFQVFDNNSGLKSNNTFVSTDSLYEVVLKILRQFQKCSEEDKLPSYIFPCQNVFQFPDAINWGEERKERRKLFIKEILRMIE